MANSFERRVIHADRADDQQWIDDRSVDGNGFYNQRWADWLTEAIEYGRSHPAE